MFKLFLITFFGIFLLSACIHTNRIHYRLPKIIRKDSIFRSAHSGIAIWDSEKNKYLFRYQSDHYFVPASNVKIPTLYAALTYLPDSLPSFDYYRTPDTLFILPKGEPTLFDTGFSYQRTLDFLKQESKPVVILPVKWETEIYGKGWAWDDYPTSYTPEKSPMPVNRKDTGNHISGAGIIYPSVEDMYDRAAGILSDTLGLPVMSYMSERIFNETPQTFYASSRDSVCKKMMVWSNNQIAEQLLLMTSDKLMGSMNETKLIEKILSDSMLQFPQKPVWVDGSGLSRYNLFTPEDMVYLLKILEKNFGPDRIKQIFPTGNEGTLKGHYDNKAGFLYAKTGTLSGQVSLSGYLTTTKNTPLVFSVMINNHTWKASEVRQAIGAYLDWIRKRY